MYRTEGEVIRGTSIIVIQTRPLDNVDALIGGKENKKLFICRNGDANMIQKWLLKFKCTYSWGLNGPGKGTGKGKTIVSNSVIL